MDKRLFYNGSKKKCLIEHHFLKINENKHEFFVILFLL